MNKVTTIGIDLAKNVFQLHGADKDGKKVYGKRLSRSEMITFLAKHESCVVGIESCGGSFHWARMFTKMGHIVKIMAPQFVKPYVKADKTDSNDARAIAEAVTRPDMNFVPHKTLEQQDLQLIHQVRELAIKQRTALINQLRGFLNEYGVILPRGISHASKVPLILEDAENSLTTQARAIIHELYEEFTRLNERVKQFDKQLRQQALQDERCLRLMEVPGIGEITATAIVAKVGNAKVFKNARQMGAWLGLVPKQHSSGQRTRMQGISKRGDKYLRQLLIHGGRSVVLASRRKTDVKSLWVREREQLGGRNKAAVAVAHKNARIIWAMLTRGETYRRAPEPIAQAPKQDIVYA